MSPRSTTRSTTRSTVRAGLAALATALGLAALVVPAPAHAGQLNLTIGIQGAGYVRVVEASLEDGGSPICDQTANLDHRVTLDCARLRNEEAFEAWAWLRPTTAHSPAGWEFVEWRGCDFVRDNDGAKECGVGSAPFGTTSKHPVAVFRDTLAPTVSQLAAQQGGTPGSFTLTWQQEGASRTECRVVGGAWEACSSPYQRVLAEGTHQLQVRAEDPSGNLSDAPTVSVTAVDAILWQRPAYLSNVRSADFSWSSNSATSYDCALDGISVACTNDGSVRLDHLGEGWHTFIVRGRDGAWSDPTPLRWDWKVDTTLPATTLTGGPADGAIVTSTSAAFTLASDEAGAGFGCSLDGAPVACSAGPLVLGPLAPGTHLLRATATDTAGNADATPATRTWTVPVPARSLARSSGWSLKSVPSAYGGRVLATTRKGAAAAYTVSKAKRLALVASGGTTHGTVRVYAGSRLLKTVSLRTSRSVTQRVIPIAGFGSAWSGRIRVVVVSSGRSVRLEGIAAPTR